MGNTKLNRNAENILKMLKSNAPEYMAKWIDVILDDLASTVDNRAVAEYHFITEDGKMIASGCYVTTPQVGEFIEMGNGDEYEVTKVKHVFARASDAGTITIRLTSKLLK